MADRYGNLKFRHAQANFSPAMATAARLTIAEVREVVEEPLAQHVHQVHAQDAEQILPDVAQHHHHHGGDPGQSCRPQHSP